jgi:hypothetical protein
MAAEYEIQSTNDGETWVTEYSRGRYAAAVSVARRLYREYRQQVQVRVLWKCVDDVRWRNGCEM